jgi:tRNA(fMet)-specific endonuclease VapC
MKRYLLDSNVILKCLQNQAFKDHLQGSTEVFSADNQAIMSIVSIGELKAIALRNGWGATKTGLMLNFLEQFIILGINAEDITDKYAEIDAFSQGKHLSLNHGLSARNMGKNDLWIAASASITKATLLTLDKDKCHSTIGICFVEKMM